LVLISFLVFNTKENNIEIVPTAIIFLVCGLIIWALLDTRYVMRDQKLFYRPGPFRNSFDVNSIKKIECYSGYFVPKKIKPALDCKGFRVYYSKFDCIYISPANAQIFLKTLKDSNQDIELAGIKGI
jgi:hypothetical protein